MRLYRNKLKLYSNGKLYNVIMKPKELEGFIITYNIDTGNSTTSTVKAGTPVLNYTPTKDGYTFVGWREDSTANETVLSGTTATKDMTLYAVFSKSITVSYNANGGSGSTASQTGTVYYNNGNTVGATFTLSNNGFSYTNGIFLKWAIDDASGTQYSVGDSITIYESTTCYAIWEVKQEYTVTVTDTSSQFNLIISGKYASIMIGSTSCTKVGTYIAKPGDTLTITALKTGNRSAVIVNGETMIPQTSNKFTFEHTINSDLSFVFEMRTINSLTTSVYNITTV